ncbi:MAG TPA: hypothetical protein VNQ73_06275 [Ilumatobacter sp.]|nr:hypothetical protein [Ilumatobacter sp.]
MNRLHTLAAAAGLLAVFAGCTRDGQVATAPPASTDAPVTTPVATTAVPTLPPPTTVPTTVPTTTAPPTTVPATTVPTTTAAPTTVPPTTAAPVPVDRVVTVQYGFSPIGVWDGDAWRFPEWDGAGLPVFVSDIASVVVTGLGLAEPVTGASYGPLEYHCVGDEQGPTLVLPPGVELPDAGPGSISVTADWDVQPRPVTQVGLDHPEYHAVGQALVDPASGADPTAGTVTQVVRADLDGNGIEEVLFTFEHQSDDGGFGSAGDYTLIVARYPHADGTVDDVVLWSYYEDDPIDFPNPGTGELLAIADLNGDGVMEVVTAHMYWEAVIAEIHALVDGRLAQATGGGCGV